MPEQWLTDHALVKKLEFQAPGFHLLSLQDVNLEYIIMRIQLSIPSTLGKNCVNLVATKSDHKC